MANLQIKGIDEDLYAQLKEMAHAENRSLSQQILFLAKDYLAKRKKIRNAKTPAQVLLELSGSWNDDRSAEEIITEFFEFFNDRDLDRLRGLLAENAQFHFPKTQPLLSPERILKFLHVLFRQYPELVFTVHRTIIQENRAAVHWTNRGKNRRGEPYENEGMTLLEFEAGKIAFISDFFKDTGKF